MTNDEEKAQLLDMIEQKSSRIRDLELVLGQRDEALAGTFRLTPMQHNLLGLLLNVPFVSPEMVRQRLEISQDAKVAFFRLRRDLGLWAEKNEEPPIEIHSKRGLGYWLEDEDKLRVRKIIAEAVRRNAQMSASSIAPEPPGNAPPLKNASQPPGKQTAIG